ncbi:MAG TPA: transcriptional regulator [candidate division Zixibacteria bacterium]|nr:transcriptional regulator [candidate division Zixibacteria bacterium]
MNTKKTEISNNLSDLMDIDKDIHEPARLMILSYLFVLESVDFVFLRGQTGLTWGNLSSHIAKLEEKQYVEVKKEFVRKKPRTIVKLTDKGKEAFLKYREKIKQILG